MPVVIDPPSPQPTAPSAPTTSPADSKDPFQEFRFIVVIPLREK
jgi:hypothetical protein